MKQANSIYWFFIFILVISLSSCKEDPNEQAGITDLGYHYYFARNQKTPVVKPGEVIFFNAELYVGGVLERRSIDLGRTMRKLMEPKDSFLLKAQQDPNSQFIPVNELLYKMSKGDSVVIDKTGLYKPQDSTKSKEITWRVSVVDIKTYKEVEEAEAKRLEKLRKDKEEWEGNYQAISTNFNLYIKDIEDGNKKAATTYTKNKVMVVILKPGTGKKPVMGERVRFHYYANNVKKGMLEETYTSGRPEQLIVGAFALNVGLEEALMEIPKGSKAMLRMPAEVANMSSKIPSAIPPGTTLDIFIDLLEDQPEL